MIRKEVADKTMKLRPRTHGYVELLARSEGTTLNGAIHLAVVEKLKRLGIIEENGMNMATVEVPA